jgi:hypothetical protein
VISHLISRASVGFLALGGLVLLFVPDVILPRLIPGYPSSGVWFAQLLAAAWLALACLNWFNRTALLGGIYSRPVVVSNAVCYFVGATALLKAATRQHLPGTCWFLVVPVTLFALVYGWLLFRGPFERDVAVYSRSQQRLP